MLHVSATQKSCSLVGYCVCKRLAGTVYLQLVQGRLSQIVDGISNGRFLAGLPRVVMSS